MTEDLKKAVAKRVATFDEDDPAVDKARAEELRIVLSDIDWALEFIRRTGTDFKVYMLNESLCDMWDATHDSRFIEAYRYRAEKMEAPEMKRSILQEISWVWISSDVVK